MAYTVVYCTIIGYLMIFSRLILQIINKGEICMDKLLKMMNEGKCVYGPFMKTGDPAFVEIVGHAGFDFVILDLEHGPSNELALQNLIRGAQIANLCPIVRVSKLDEVLIGRALDVGAQGVQIPQVTTSEEAVIAVKAAKFAPLGERGVC